jgi:heterotetrameric sarcosine oxidase delta subunit
VSFLLECPHCGERDVNEYHYHGETVTRPGPEHTLHDLTSYIFFRKNPAGILTEWWCHSIGCGAWFIADRDTRTNQVFGTRIPEPDAHQPMRSRVVSGGSAP